MTKFELTDRKVVKGILQWEIRKARSESKGDRAS